MRVSYFLILILGIASFHIYSYSEMPRPIKPKHLSCLFKYSTLVHEIELNECHPEWWENIRDQYDQARDDQLQKYTVDPKEKSALIQEFKSRVEVGFREIKNEKVEKAREIAMLMHPYLPSKLRTTSIHLIEHKKFKDNYINAFTFPGRIYISSGLWKRLQNDDQLAVVIGHEFGHLTSNHFEEAFQVKQRWIERLEQIGIESPSGVSLATAVEEYLATPLDQTDELESDLIGVYLAFKAGFNPKWGSNLLDELSAVQSHERNFLSKLSSSHPESSDRNDCIISYINQAIDSADYSYNLAMAKYKVDWFAYSTQQTRLSRKVVRIANSKPVYQFLSFLGLLLTCVKRRPRRINKVIRTTGFSVTLISVAALFIEVSHTPTLPVVGDNYIAQVTSCLYNDKDGCNWVEIYKRVSKDEVAIRAAPHLGSRVEAKAIKGDKVSCHYCSLKGSVDDRTGRWCYITSESVSGWVWGWYLQ